MHFTFCILFSFYKLGVVDTTRGHSDREDLLLWIQQTEAVTE